MAIKGKGTGTGKAPFYKNWVFWLVIAISLALVITGCSIAFGPKTVLRVLTEPSSYLAAVAAITFVGGIGAGVLKALQPVFEEFTRLKKTVEKVEEKAQVAETKAVTVENVVKEVTATTADNSERADLLEKSSEALSRQYLNLTRSYEALSLTADRLTENLEQQQDRANAKIERLEGQLERITLQNNERQAEIIELKELHRSEMNELKEEHKAAMLEHKEQMKGLLRENTELRKRVTDLEIEGEKLRLEVDKLKSENLHLLEENRGLKETRGRRQTDSLNPAILPAQPNGNEGR